MAADIGLEEFHRLLYQGTVRGRDAETPAVPDIQIRKVEGKHVEPPAVYDQELVVIPHQVAGRPGNCNARRKQPHFQFPQLLFAVPVGGCDQRMHGYAARRRVRQSPLQFSPVAPENSYLHALARAVDGLDHRRQAVFRLD